MATPSPNPGRCPGLICRAASGQIRKRAEAIIRAVIVTVVGVVLTVSAGCRNDTARSGSKAPGVAGAFGLP